MESGHTAYGIERLFAQLDLAWRGFTLLYSVVLAQDSFSLALTSEF